MNTIARLLIASAIAVLFTEACGEAPGQPGIKESVGTCSEQAKMDKCTSINAGNTAWCYADGEVGPAPWSSEEPYPAYGCGAPVNRDGTGNTFGPAQYEWANWWCCGKMKCDAGSTGACTCQSGKPGARACTASGEYGACVCDD